MHDTAMGRARWYELLTSDPGGAWDFYKPVVGWTTESWEGGKKPYTMWVAAEGPVGGVMELPRAGHHRLGSRAGVLLRAFRPGGKSIRSTGGDAYLPDVGPGAHPLGGTFRKPPEMRVADWVLCIRVEDVGAAVQFVKELGGQVLQGPMEVRGGDMVAQCMDPTGAAFAVHSSGQAET